MLSSNQTENIWEKRKCTLKTQSQKNLVSLVKAALVSQFPEEILISSTCWAACFRDGNLLKVVRILYISVQQSSTFLSFNRCCCIGKFSKTVETLHLTFNQIWFFRQQYWTVLRSGILHVIWQSLSLESRHEGKCSLLAHMITKRQYSSVCGIMERINIMVFDVVSATKKWDMWDWSAIVL